MERKQYVTTIVLDSFEYAKAIFTTYIHCNFLTGIDVDILFSLLITSNSFYIFDYLPHPSYLINFRKKYDYIQSMIIYHAAQLSASDTKVPEAANLPCIIHGFGAIAENIEI